MRVTCNLIVWKTPKNFAMYVANYVVNKNRVESFLKYQGSEHEYFHKIFTMKQLSRDTTIQFRHATDAAPMFISIKYR